MWDPGQRVLRDKMKLRLTFKEEGVPKGNIDLGSRLGKERQEAPCLTGGAEVPLS